MSHTILDLAHAGLDVVEREVAHFILEAVEIHLGRGLSGERRSLGERWCCRRTIRTSVLVPGAVGEGFLAAVVPGLETPERTLGSSAGRRWDSLESSAMAARASKDAACSWSANSTECVQYSTLADALRMPDRRSRHRIPGRRRSLEFLHVMHTACQRSASVAVSSMAGMSAICTHSLRMGSLGCMGGPGMGSGT